MDRFETEISNVGEGWQPIVRKLHGQLLALDPTVEVDNIEVINGTLRFDHRDNLRFTSPPWIKAQAYLKEAERQCSTTCETCGKPGRAKTIGGGRRPTTFIFCSRCHSAALSAETESSERDAG